MGRGSKQSNRRREGSSSTAKQPKPTFLSFVPPIPPIACVHSQFFCYAPVERSNRSKQASKRGNRVVELATAECLRREATYRLQKPGRIKLLVRPDRRGR